MIEFATLQELALRLVEHDLPAIDREVEKGLDKASLILQRAAIKMFGTYQAGIGPFDTWQELADSTKEERVKLGFTENEAIVGSTSDIMPYHEFGTSRMPPRPVLGIALYRNWPIIQQLMGDGVTSAFIGEDRVHRSLGYDLS